MNNQHKMEVARTLCARRAVRSTKARWHGCWALPVAVCTCSASAPKPIRSWRCALRQHIRKTIPWTIVNWLRCAGTGKNRVRRVMHKYGIAARSLREARMSTEASQPRLCRSQLREEAFEWVGNEVVFSDILEVKLADGTRVRGCFASSPNAP